MASSQPAVTATRRRHLRAAGINALIALAAFALTGVWTAIASLSRPDTVVFVLGIVTYAWAAMALVRLVGAAIAWPR